MSSTYSSPLHLAGRHVVLTGASRGLGHAIARQLWQAGAHLALVARSASIGDGGALGPAAVPGQQLLAVAADLADPEAPAAIAARVGEHWPHVHALINNAGVIGPIGTLEENDWAGWEQTIRVNLLAPVALCRALLPRMPAGGAIVNLSGGGATSPRPHFGAYATSKAGLVRFSENLAVELAARRIRVNTVAPGPMNTRMLDAVLEAGESAAGKEFSKAVDQLKQGGVAPEKAAELVVWLVSEESAPVTGRLISAVWDRWAELGAHAPELAGTDIYTLRRITPEDRGKKWDS